MLCRPFAGVGVGCRATGGPAAAPSQHCACAALGSAGHGACMAPHIERTHRSCIARLPHALGKLGRAVARSVSRVALYHQVRLQERHAECASLHGRDEPSGLVSLVREELEEEPPDLGRGGVAHVVDHVDAAGADERRVEAFDVIGGHEEKTLLSRGDAVESIEKTGEGDKRGAPVARVPVFEEGRVDVFQQDEGGGRRVGEGVGEAVIGQAWLGKVEHANVVADASRECRNERGFARAGSPVEQVASAVRDASGDVPRLRLHELSDVAHDVFGDPIVEHHRREGAAAAGRAEGPPLGPPIGVDGGGLLLLRASVRLSL
mmetsp:Transcript_25943/g.83812  ORF Transcript_25943/g.83812 Transcript_25943/m.83812 type:complete len:319 (-) Transcript_25943:264-1220(-)